MERRVRWAARVRSQAPSEFNFQGVREPLPYQALSLSEVSRSVVSDSLRAQGL